MNSDGIPDVLQQLQVGYGASVVYGVSVNFELTMTVTGVDMNRDGIPDVLVLVRGVDQQVAVPTGDSFSPTTAA